MKSLYLSTDMSVAIKQAVALMVSPCFFVFFVVRHGAGERQYTLLFSDFDFADSCYLLK